MPKGFVTLILLLLFAASVAILSIILVKEGKFNLQSFPLHRTAEKTAEIPIQEREEYKIFMNLNTKYQGTKLISSGNYGGTYKDWGFWSTVEGTDGTDGVRRLTVDPVYGVQTINGVKNMLVILNNVDKLEFHDPSEGDYKVYIGFSSKYIKDFEDIVIIANKKLQNGTSFSKLIDVEADAYLLANPTSGDDVLKEEKYRRAYEVVRDFIIAENKDIFDQIIRECDLASTDNLKNYCLAVVSSGHVDGYDCKLIPEYYREYRGLCYSARAIELQNFELCNLADAYQASCKKGNLGGGAVGTYKAKYTDLK